MGIYYEYAIVHGRVLVWWHDMIRGLPHSKWIEGEEAEWFLERYNKRDFEHQSDLARLVKIKD